MLCCPMFFVFSLCHQLSIPVGLCPTFSFLSMLSCTYASACVHHHSVSASTYSPVHPFFMTVLLLTRLPASVFLLHFLRSQKLWCIHITFLVCTFLLICSTTLHQHVGTAFCTNASSTDYMSSTLSPCSLFGLRYLLPLHSSSLHLPVLCLYPIWYVHVTRSSPSFSPGLWSSGGHQHSLPSLALPFLPILPFPRSPRCISARSEASPFSRGGSSNTQVRSCLVLCAPCFKSRTKFGICSSQERKKRILFFTSETDSS